MTGLHLLLFLYVALVVFANIGSGDWALEPTWADRFIIWPAEAAFATLGVSLPLVLVGITLLAWWLS